MSVHSHPTQTCSSSTSPAPIRQAYGTYRVTVLLLALTAPHISGLQQRELLLNLLRGVVQARDEAPTSPTRRPKLVLKISPDLDSQGLEDIADAVSIVKGIDGVIVTNTTVQRPSHLRNGPSAPPSPPYLLNAPNIQRTAPNKEGSPVRHYSLSHSKPSAAYASACLPKYPS